MKVSGLMETLVGVIDVVGVKDYNGGVEGKKKKRKIYRNRFLKKFQDDGDDDDGTMDDTNGIGYSSVEEEESESSSVSESESSSCSDTKDGTCDGCESSDSDENDEPSEDETEGHESQGTNEDDGELGEMSKMEICFKTPFSLEEKNNEVDYDADPNKFLHGARLSVFACLLCLVKSRENAVSCFCLCCNDTALITLIVISYCLYLISF